MKDPEVLDMLLYLNVRQQRISLVGRDGLFRGLHHLCVVVVALLTSGSEGPRVSCSIMTKQSVYIRTTRSAPPSSRRLSVSNPAHHTTRHESDVRQLEERWLEQVNTLQEAQKTLEAQR